MMTTLACNCSAQDETLDTRWSLARMDDDEFEMMTCRSLMCGDDDGDCDARYISGARTRAPASRRATVVSCEDEMLAPQDLLVPRATSPTPSLPLPRRLCTSEDGAVAAAAVPSGRSTPRRSPSASMTSASSGGESSAEEATGSTSSSSLRRSRRAVSRLVKSPEGPRFASGAYKNAPSPAALPPPPPAFCATTASPPPRQAQQRCSASCTSPGAGRASPVRTFSSSDAAVSVAVLPDPAIIAAAVAGALAPALPPQPLKQCGAAQGPCDPLEAMTQQLCQMLKIRA
eukprot:m51a1_g1403 hypothetical protein (287) ;mRNA; r:499760-501229